MPANLTKRQERFWRKRMIELEKSLIAYYATRTMNPTTVDPPDGSFCMNAFKSGYYLARRKDAR